MTNRSDTDDYRALFLSDIPLMDVRAPVEFAKGTIPGSVNVPILDDEQRDAIGKRYKQAGQDEAIALGLELATDEIRAERLRDWKAFVDAHPQGYLYCFRGGLRSRTTQAWLREQGVDYPLIKGGYKAIRQFLITELEQSQEQIPLFILSGLTGSGKTHVLNKTPFHVDLEGLANHRGSAFGRDPLDYQPTQIDWENRLSVACLRHREFHPGVPLLLEDEGKMIGRALIPDGFYQKMVAAPRIFLERDIAARVEIIRRDYIAENWPRYQQAHGDDAQTRFSQFVLDNLARIRNRLGGERYAKIHDMFSLALERLFDEGCAAGFDEGIQLLLEEYYDPMYRYQLKKKPVEVIFSGSEQDILQWVETNITQPLQDNENTLPGAPRQIVVG